MNLEQDREWGALLLIIRFLDEKAGKGLESLYVDKVKERVNVEGLKAHPMSSGQAFLVRLGIHLFNCGHHWLPSDGLGGMDNLDNNYMAVAMKAINMRFGGG